MPGTSDAKFVGVDWAKGGWFSIGFDVDGHYDMAYGKFRELLDHYPSAALILVDIPIGLASGQYERRECDGKAKDYVGARCNSVFWTPPRHVVEDAHKAKANGATPGEYKNLLLSMNAARPKGTKFTIQAWNIAPMIAEVDVVARSPSLGGTRGVREVHPEVCFRALGRGREIAPKKVRQKINPAAMDQRIQILQQFEPRTREVYDHALAAHSGHAAADDILDALAAAVTAREGYPDRLPDATGGTPMDAYGLPMEMVFYNPTP